MNRTIQLAVLVEVFFVIEFAIAIKVFPNPDEMYALQQAWEEEMRDLELAQQEQEEAEEKRQEKEQQIIDYWEIMEDKLLDK